jgi:hypothetical protein
MMQTDYINEGAVSFRSRAKNVKVKINAKLKPGVIMDTQSKGVLMMTGKKIVVMLVLVFSLIVAAPVFAAAPAEGTVVEGVSVPGVALGDTRVQVKAAYGDPYNCSTVYEVGDDGRCSYPVEGLDHLGRIRISFRGPDGGLPSASPHDVVSAIAWSDSVPGWVTQEGGVNTEWARSVAQDPEAVLAVYPNAVISYTGLFGSMSRARDYELGIMIEWQYSIYSGALGVSLTILPPAETPPPPPPPEPVTRVTNLNLYANKIKGNRTLTASVWVDDEYWANLPGATVVAVWTYPNGSMQQVQAVTSSSGLASFELFKIKSGTYKFEVVDVIYPKHRFDRELSTTLTASIRVK